MGYVNIHPHVNTNMLHQIQLLRKTKCLGLEIREIKIKI